MGIDKSHIPDISVVSNLEGNEVMIVEVKASYPSEDAKQAVRLLKEYMVSFYTEVGLLVTPTETVVMNKTYLDKKKPRRICCQIPSNT